jgi:hypothetical protein
MQEVINVFLIIIHSKGGGIIICSTLHQGSPFMEPKNVEHRAESLEHDVIHGESRF